MKNKAKNYIYSFLFIIIIIFFVIYAFYQIYKATYRPFKTELVNDYNINQSIHVDGIVVRTETLVENVTDSSVTYLYEDASKVNKNKVLAYTHASSDTVNKISRLDSLKNDINLLQESLNGAVSQLYGSSEYINSQIGSYFINYTNSVSTGNLSDFKTIKNSLLLSINKKTFITGKENRFQEKIDSLNAEYENLKKEIDSDEEGTILSPQGGYFISKIDGYETLINKNSLMEMKVKDFESLLITNPTIENNYIGKIADNYKWYYCFTYNTDSISDFNNTKTVLVKFDGLNDYCKFTIKTIISDDSSTNSIIVLECDEFLPEYTYLRTESADVTINSYNGLKISTDAIHFNNKQEIGVYVIENNAIKFKKVDIIYEGQDFVIIDKDITNLSGVQLYDEVIISGKDIFEGKIVEQ